MGGGGGWEAGSPVYWADYLSMTNDQELAATPGTEYTFSSEGEVICGFVGSPIFLANRGLTAIRLRAIGARSQRDDPVRLQSVLQPGDQTSRAGASGASRRDSHRRGTVERCERLPSDRLAGLLNAPSFVAFTKADIAFVYGSIWKQRNFTPVITEKYGIPNPLHFLPHGEKSDQ